MCKDKKKLQRIRLCIQYGLQVAFYVIYSNFGVDATNSIIRTKFDNVNRLQNQPDEADENVFPWEQV